MAACKPEVLKRKYVNWVKAQLAVLYTKEGIEPFVFDEIQQFQQKCLNDIWESRGLKSGSTCSSCYTENVVVCPTSKICNTKPGKCSFHRNFITQYRLEGCPNNICSKLKSEILSAHTYYSPSFQNTDATKWCKDPWEIAKCFMPPEGYKDVTSVAKTDINGIASVIINHKRFQQKIQGQLDNGNNAFEKVRVIGKTLRYSTNLEVEAKDLDQYIADLKTLLTVPGHFETDQHVIAARKKLLQLEYDMLAIDKADLRKIFDDIEKVVADRIRIETDKQRKETDEQNLELMKTSKRLLGGSRGQKSLTLTELEQILTSALIKARKIKEEATKLLEDKKQGSNFYASTRPEPFIIENDKKNQPRPNIVAKQPKRNFCYSFNWIPDENKEQAIEIYLAKMNDLKHDLIQWYRDHYSMMPLSPLCDELEVPLLSFYTRPEMYGFDLQTVVGSEIRSRIESLTDVFWTRGRRDELKENMNIYVVGDAGSGKTAFIKYLTLAWCQAHSPDPELEGYFAEEDLKHMRAFEILFLIFLRDSIDLCCVDKMIYKRCIANMPKYSKIHKDFLEDLLRHEKTIVMLDGLDEWEHPDVKCLRRRESEIPHAYARDHFTVITTLREWKLSQITLRNSEVDNRIDIMKLSKDKFRMLAEKALARLIPLNLAQTENPLGLFDEQVTKNNLEDLVSNPLLLFHIACMFYKDPSTAQSKSKICSSIIDLYLARTLKRPGPKQLCEPLLSDIPQCFREEAGQHEKYNKLLMSIGKLAFHMLFSEDQSQIKKARDCFVEGYLSREELRVSLLSGILTEIKVVTLIRKYTNISFPQRTLQEYLCAKYISCQSLPEVEEYILTGCGNIQDILNMSTALEFVGGINQRLLSHISRKLMPVINEDEITQNYRARTLCDNIYTNPLIDLQNMYMACIKDSPEDNEFKVCLQDLFILDNQAAENYLDQVVTLMKQDKDIWNIKSIFIDNIDDHSLTEVMDLLGEADLCNVQKVFYRGWRVDENLAFLLVDQLTSLTLIFERKIFVRDECTIPQSLCGHILSLRYLENICIMNFTICHNDLEAIFKVMSNKKNLKEVKLHKLSCSDHGISCRGFYLDLLNHSELKRLGFGSIPLSQLNINVSVLEECHVGGLSKPGLIPACFQQLQTAEKLHTYECSNLTSLPEIEGMRQTLSTLSNVKQIAFTCINLGQSSLTLTPEMVHLELVQLCQVTISATSLHWLRELVDMLPQSVTVLLQNCNVAPEMDFKFIKKHISSCGKYVVPIDGDLSDKENSFAFRTIRQKDESEKPVLQLGFG